MQQRFNRQFPFWRGLFSGISNVLLPSVRNLIVGNSWKEPKLFWRISTFKFKFLLQAIYKSMNQRFNARGVVNGNLFNSFLGVPFLAGRKCRQLFQQWQISFSKRNILQDCKLLSCMPESLDVSFFVEGPRLEKTFDFHFCWTYLSNQFLTSPKCFVWFPTLDSQSAAF